MDPGTVLQNRFSGEIYIWRWVAMAPCGHERASTGVTYDKTHIFVYHLHIAGLNIAVRRCAHLAMVLNAQHETTRQPARCNDPWHP